MNDFTNIIINDREKAEEILAALRDQISRFGVARVSDLYNLVGLSSKFTDEKRGWHDLEGAGIQRVRKGYYSLILPQAKDLG